MQKQKPIKPYKKLKQTQKARVAEKMYQAVCNFHAENGSFPTIDEANILFDEIYLSLHCIVPTVTQEDLREMFLKKQEHFVQRFAKSGLPEPRKTKVKTTEAEKLAIKRAQRRARKERLSAQKERENQPPDWQDDQFFYIVGYTSGGAPYGVTWEEMGLNPCENPE